MRAGTGLVVVLRCRICRSPARRPVPATSSSPSVLRRAATTAQMPARRLSAVESSTLLQALEAVPDPRQRRGRRHPLYSIPSVLDALPRPGRGAGRRRLVGGDRGLGGGHPPRRSAAPRLAACEHPPPRAWPV